MSRSDQSRHLPGLDLLRAIAIVWVMAYHLASHGPLATLALSLYLTHKAVFHLVDTYAGRASGASNLLALVSYAAAALLVATLLYLALERPGLRLRAALASRAVCLRRRQPHSPT